VFCRIAYKNPTLQEYPYSAAGRTEFQYFSDLGTLHPMARILIADDHDGTRGILRVLLQQHSGWEVCGEASTGEETLKKCIELKPDVIVKDWVMPGMDSIQLTREIPPIRLALQLSYFLFMICLSW